MNKKIFSNWKIGIAISVLLPFFGILNQTGNQSEKGIENIFSAWFFSFSFLLIAWFINSRLSTFFFFTENRWNIVSKIIVISLFNSILVFLLILLIVIGDYWIESNSESNYILIFIRASIAVGIIYLVQHTLNLNARNQTVALQNQMLKTENIRAQFEILRQQISPHFLFNSLSTLRSMIRSSNKNAENFVIKLSDIFRLLLINKERDTVTLKEELELIDDYSFLLFARYENMISIDIDIPGYLQNRLIPTFSLQILLENSVKHNIVSKDRPLHIKIYDSGNYNITIENNLQQKVVTGEGSGLGLQNLIKRYEFLGIDEGVQIFSDESVFRVKIKLLEQ
ncbi:MAG: histidine kinase [Cyclobacteriaceae bacterium]|jgi:LytS/YehU family sensor histidine kinase